MRAAASKRYGLIHAGDVLDKKYDVAVYLDGEDVTSRCACADDELGFVVLHTTKPPTLNLETGKSKREIRFGEVHIFACEKEG